MLAGLWKSQANWLPPPCPTPSSPSCGMSHAAALPDAGADEDYQGTCAQAPCEVCCVVFSSEAHAPS